MMVYIGLLFLGQLVRGLTATGRELPIPTQSSGRVLAVINGAWSLENWSAPVRLRYLASQLHRYVAACEEGFEIHVALVTYEGWNYTGAWNDRDYVCLRRSELLAIGVYMYPFEPLPKGTFGTAGTLAFQHRKLFLRKRALYDTFICQEDDVAVNVGHIKYFLHWAGVFKGTNLYPGFYDSEVMHTSEPVVHRRNKAQSETTVALDWRFKNGQLFKWFNMIFFKSFFRASGRAYFLTAEMLARFCHSRSWLTQLRNYRGEFNPFFGSAAWMEDTFHVVIPLDDFIRAQVHHLSEKYVTEQLKKYLENPGSTKPDKFTPIFQRELSLIFNGCKLGKMDGQLPTGRMHEERPENSSSASFQEACTFCVNLGNILKFRITKQRLFSSFVSLKHCCVKRRLKFLHTEECRESQFHLSD